MARPKKAPEEKRDTRLELRLTARERAALDSRADTYGLTAAEYMRKRSLGEPLPASVAARTERIAKANALIRLGTNLNQIAHRMNAGQDAPAYLSALIARIDAELDNLYANTPDSDFD